MRIEQPHNVNPNIQQNSKTTIKGADLGVNFASAIAEVAASMKTAQAIKKVGDSNQASVAGFDKNKMTKEEKKSGISEVMKQEADEIIKKIDGAFKSKKEAK